MLEGRDQTDWPCVGELAGRESTPAESHPLQVLRCTWSFLGFPLQFTFPSVPCQCGRAQPATIPDGYPSCPDRGQSHEGFTSPRPDAPCLCPGPLKASTNQLPLFITLQEERHTLRRCQATLPLFPCTLPALPRPPCRQTHLSSFGKKLHSLPYTGEVSELQSFPQSHCGTKSIVHAHGCHAGRNVRLAMSPDSSRTVDIRPGCPGEVSQPWHAAPPQCPLHLGISLPPAFSRPVLPELCRYLLVSEQLAPCCPFAQGLAWGTLHFPTPPFPLLSTRLLGRI